MQTILQLSFYLETPSTAVSGSGLSFNAKNSYKSPSSIQRKEEHSLPTTDRIYDPKVLDSYNSH